MSSWNTKMLQYLTFCRKPSHLEYYPTPHWNLNCMRNTSSNILAPIQFQWPARSFGTTQLLGKFRMRTSRKAACHELYLLATIEIVWETHIYIYYNRCWSRVVIAIVEFWILHCSSSRDDDNQIYHNILTAIRKTVGCRWPALTVCGTDMAAHGEKYQWHSI